MRIYVIRHGETTANKLGLFQGSVDNPLNESGIFLAQETGKGLKEAGIKFDVCYCSPYIRARQTAEELLKYSENDCETIIDDRIREINNGDYEGVSIVNPDPEHKAMVEGWMKDGFSVGRFPNGESGQDVCDRTQKFLNEIVKKDYKSVLVSTHGAALRGMLNFLYEDKNNFWHGMVPVNCSISIVDYEDGKFTLVADDKVFYDEKYIVDNYK